MAQNILEQLALAVAVLADMEIGYMQPSNIVIHSTQTFIFKALFLESTNKLNKKTFSANLTPVP
ncbi:hypothetical protein [Methylomonas sp. CM2]|uniref:hypothetical protein n=1 Tax=Methylomonas sp. CM2 TaxID=3417647 RepID=UPI003CF5AFF4